MVVVVRLAVVAFGVASDAMDALCRALSLSLSTIGFNWARSGRRQHEQSALAKERVPSVCAVVVVAAIVAADDGLAG